MESTDEQSSIIMVRSVGEGGGRGGVTVVEGKYFMLTLLCACIEVALHIYSSLHVCYWIGLFWTHVLSNRGWYVSR